MFITPVNVGDARIPAQVPYTNSVSWENIYLQNFLKTYYKFGTSHCY